MGNASMSARSSTVAPFAQKPDHPRAADLLRDLVSMLAQPVGGDASRPMLLHRKFRVRVEVLVNALDLGEQIVGGAREACLSSSGHLCIIRRPRLTAKTHQDRQRYGELHGFEDAAVGYAVFHALTCPARSEAPVLLMHGSGHVATIAHTNPILRESTRRKSVVMEQSSDAVLRHIARFDRADRLSLAKAPVEARCACELPVNHLGQGIDRAKTFNDLRPGSSPRTDW
jgi:hypothetical protein